MGENNSPKFTFLMPAYKLSFFEEALSSILKQTYTKFKVIVSDDCSPYDLKSVVDSHADSRVTYRRNEINIGAKRLVDHWNKLLELVDTPFCIMASDDDLYDDDFLLKIDKLITENPNASVYRPLVREIDEHGRIIKQESCLPSYLTQKEFLSLWVNSQIGSGISYYVFNLERLKNVGGFARFPYAWYSDDATIMRLSEHGLAVSNNLLFSFRFSGQNISTVTSPSIELDKYHASIQFFRYVRSLNPDQKVFLSLKELICKRARNSFCCCGSDRVRTVILLDMLIRRSVFPLPWVMRRIKDYIGFIKER